MCVQVATANRSRPSSLAENMLKGKVVPVLKAPNYKGVWGVEVKLQA